MTYLDTAFAQFEVQGACSACKSGVPLASDDPQAARVAAQLMRDINCEQVVTRELASSVSLRNGGPGFRASTTAPELRRLPGIA